jgi:hypothetical protein
MRRFIKRVFVVSTVAAAGHQAMAGTLHGGDVILTVQNDRIVTNAIDGGSGEPVEQRAFLAVFADVGGFWSTINPGFDCAAGTFPPGTSIQFHLLDAVREWDGADFDTLAEEQISMEFGPAGPTFTPTTPDTRVDGFTIPVQSNGGWHKHYDFYLESPAGPGVYLLKMSLSNPGGYDESEPFYLVFGRSADPAEHAAAVDYVLDTLLAGSCPGDINGDLSVDTADLGLLLNAFGTPDAGADINEDMVVDTADLGLLLNAFGQPCP